MKILVLSVILLTLSIPALAFDKSGYLDNGLYYNDVEVVQGDPQPFNTGGVSGKIKYIRPWLLSGTIENAENRPRKNIQVRFTATNCAGDSTYWSVVVSPGPMGSFEQVSFLKHIADFPPARPCYLNVRGYGD